jgi:hypothetical protein
MIQSTTKYYLKSKRKNTLVKMQLLSYSFFDRFLLKNISLPLPWMRTTNLKILGVYSVSSLNKNKTVSSETQMIPVARRLKHYVLYV